MFGTAGWAKVEEVFRSPRMKALNMVVASRVAASAGAGSAE